MADETKLDSSSLELAIQREITPHQNKNNVGGTLSFRDWVENGPTSDASLQSFLALLQRSPNVQSCNEQPTLPSPSQNRMGQSLVKNRPSLDKQSDPVNINSAYKDWIGPSKLSYKNFQVQAPKLFPRLNIPTKTRSDLKRKPSTDNQIQFLPSSSSSSHKMTKKPTDNLVCEICQVSCSSKLTLHQHLIGRPHKAKLEFMKLKRNCTNNRGKMGKPRCDVCQIWCSDRDALNMHFKGQKHKNKLHELEVCKKNGTGGNKINAKKPILCELCLVHCMNEDLFEMHLKGRPHAAREKLKRRGML